MRLLDTHIPQPRKPIRLELEPEEADIIRALIGSITGTGRARPTIIALYNLLIEGGAREDAYFDQYFTGTVQTRN